MNILRNVTEGIHPVGGFKRGEMIVYSAGRGAGNNSGNDFFSSYPKTTVSLNRLMPKYKFSRKWHIVDYDWKDFVAVGEWCVEQFGPQPLNPDAWCRWYQRGMGRIHFRDEADAALFILRWS